MQFLSLFPGGTVATSLFFFSLSLIRGGSAFLCVYKWKCICVDDILGFRVLA